ncbi:DUF4920 domain-containing protein [Mucilaginibacter frigoritolerans]|nr:DUF4920 domain-containing protein [Mucilaginibacter frigoritolerans]
MKSLAIIFMCYLCFAGTCLAQPVSKGTVYGTKPTPTQVIEASKLEAFMGNKVRITTDIKGKVLKVTKQKGGWFDIDAGNGKTITAHFSKYDITIPSELKGHYIIAEGIAQKQFIADDGQHMAGDTPVGKKQHTVNADPKRSITFEVNGLVVE